jgi:hypothetical protein
MNIEQIKQKLNNLESEMFRYKNKFNIYKNKNNLFTKNDSINYFVNPKTNYYFSDNLRGSRENNPNDLLMYELQKYDFNNYSILDEKELKKNIVYLLNRYNCIVNTITEDKWNIYDNNSVQTKYEITEDNKFVIDNSINKLNKSNPELLFFMQHILEICKVLAKKINYKVYPKFYDDKFNLCWLIFVFKKI